MANHTSHAALPYPIKNARFSLAVLFRTSAGTPTDPTTPDTEISTDGGATFTDTTEEITTGGGNGIGYFTLTSNDTNNNMVELACKSANCVTTGVILCPRVLASVGTGTLSAGSAGGGTLGTVLAYDVTGCFIQTTGGTGGASGSFQARKIITYTTSTGAFTVAPNWETTPDATTTYSVLLPENVTLGMLRTLNPATPGRTAVVDASGLIDANTVKVGPTGTGTAQTARDIGAAVPAATAGATGGLLIAGSNAATTFATLTSTGAFSINGTNTVAQTGDSFARIGLAGVGLTNIVLPAGGLANVVAWTVAITGTLSGNVGGIAAGGIGATSIVDGALTAAKFAANSLNGKGDWLLATSYAVPLSASDTRTALGLASPNLDTQLAAILAASSGGSGAGAYTVTVTVTDGTDPLQNATVRISEGINTFTATTDASGEANFAVDAATYAVAVTKDGYQFAPTARTVTGNQSGTLINDLEMTLIAIPISPDDPTVCRVYGTPKGPDGRIAPNVLITFTLTPLASPLATSGHLIAGRTITVRTDALGRIKDKDGNLWQDLERNDLATPAGSAWIVNSPALGMIDTSITLSTDLYDLTDVV